MLWEGCESNSAGVKRDSQIRFLPKEQAKTSASNTAILIKRVRRVQRGALHLLNDNSNYKTEVLDADQVNAVEFMGYCFAILRRIGEAHARFPYPGHGWLVAYSVFLHPWPGSFNWVSRVGHHRSLAIGSRASAL
jgi:hypothetical protein